MPAVRVGDTWTFDLTPDDLPAYPNPHIWPVSDPGDLPGPEDYHVMFTGMLEWTDPEGDPEFVESAYSLSLEAANDQSWDSTVLPNYKQSYVSTPGGLSRFPFIAQGVVQVPENLAFQVSGYSAGGTETVPVPIAHLLEARLVFTIVTAR